MSDIICQNCGQKLPDNSKFCNFCGAKAEILSARVCTSCKSEIPADMNFCVNCGKYFEIELPVIQLESSFIIEDIRFEILKATLNKTRYSATGRFFRDYNARRKAKSTEQIGTEATLDDFKK